MRVPIFMKRKMEVVKRDKRKGKKEQIEVMRGIFINDSIFNKYRKLEKKKWKRKFNEFDINKVLVK